MSAHTVAIAAFPGNVSVLGNGHSHMKMLLPAKVGVSMNGAAASPATAAAYTVIRKKQRLMPLGESRSNIICSASATNTSNSAVHKVPKKQRVTHQTLPAAHGENLPPTGGRPKAVTKLSSGVCAGSPATAAAAALLPISVARRNARERNRVKQVNNGFSALRDRIPDEVAEIFESHGTGRGSVKKLSKVETLRMAVEYIRSLEQCLVDDGVVLPEATDIGEECFDFSGNDFNGNGSLANRNDSRPNAAMRPTDGRSGGSSPLQPTLTPGAEHEEGEDEEELDELEELDDTELLAVQTADASFLDTSSSAGSSYNGSGAHAATGLTASGGTQEFIRLPAGGTFQISTPIYERDEHGVLLQHQYAGIPILDAATGLMHHPEQQQQQQQLLQQQQQLIHQQQHQQQLQLQLQLQQQQQFQQNMMLMSPAASISPNSYAQSPSPLAHIKTEECYVILPPQHLQLQQQKQHQLHHQLGEHQQQQQSPPACTALQMAADGTVYYATMAEDSLSPVPAMYALKTELCDGDGEELLLTEQEQADSMIGSSLEWWQHADGQQQQQQPPLLHEQGH